MQNNLILGAVIGDIIGSRFEFDNHKTTDVYDFELFTNQSRPTDDTVLTLAAMNAILTDTDFESNYVDFAMRYPAHLGYSFLR